MADRTPRWVGVLAVGLVFSGCLGTPGNGPGDGPTELLIGTEAAYPPFEDQDEQGNIFGFDPDVIREIANRTRYTVRLQHMEFTAIIPSIQNGQLHGGISAFTITAERRQQVDFTVPYYENELLVATLSENDDVAEEDDLARVMQDGERICTQTGTTSEQWLRDNAGATDATLLLLPTFPPCADALQRGDAVAMMIDRAAVRFLIEQSGGRLKQAFTISVDESFGIAVSKNLPAVLQAFNQALTDMRNDGTLTRLSDRWQV
ncbi:MAG TPA: transporter substrate-binding domain-containing protein [Candidatus Thermoplasmatota archaeon]|nr:transporter substrate-binding domain-containing protein [Candidatus Thermoplasmatota archaeon]